MINNKLNFIFLILLLSSVQLIYAQQNAIQSKRFRASVVKMDITPDKPKMLLGYAARQSTGING